MSMLTGQVEKLRKRAKELRQGDWSDGADDARLMDDAADTIENLRNRLTETCRNADACAEAGGMWHSPRFVCSECGAVYVMSDYARFCPSCGRQVVA